MLFCSGALASDVVIFDEMTDRVLSYRKSVHTPNYNDRNDVLINPNITPVENLARRYWKHSLGTLIPMSEIEKDQVDQEIQDARDAIRAVYDSAKTKLLGIGFTLEEIEKFLLRGI